MLSSDDKTVFVGQKLFLCQKHSYEMPNKKTFNHLTLVGFIYISI